MRITQTNKAILSLRERLNTAMKKAGIYKTAEDDLGRVLDDALRLAPDEPTQSLARLPRIIREEKIDLVHSHARAANLVAHFARGPVPMVVSVHGRWRNHFAARALPCLGERTIAICPYLSRYLSEDLRIPAASVRMVPNGIDTDRFKPEPFPAGAEKQVLFVGRFSGQKGNVIRHLLKTVFPSLVREVPEVRVKIVSFAPPAEDLERVRAFNAESGGEIVRVADGGGPTEALYREAYAVVGSGRVALEAMACARPVVAIGESSAPGLLSAETLDRAFDSNFGDCGEWNLFEKGHGVKEGLLELLNDPVRAAALGEWGRKAVLERFDAVTVARQVEAVYREALEAGR
jgi:glycosyltransferase involved in cell wall biosynthesis